MGAMVEEAATVEAVVLIEDPTVAVIVALMKAGVAEVEVTLHTTMILAIPAVVPDTAIETGLKIPTRNHIDRQVLFNA